MVSSFLTNVFTRFWSFKRWENHVKFFFFFLISEPLELVFFFYKKIETLLFKFIVLKFVVKFDKLLYGKMCLRCVQSEHTYIFAYFIFQNNFTILAIVWSMYVFSITHSTYCTKKKILHTQEIFTEVTELCISITYGRALVIFWILIQKVFYI